MLPEWPQNMRANVRVENWGLARQQILYRYNIGMTATAQCYLSERYESWIR